MKTYSIQARGDLKSETVEVGRVLASDPMQALDEAELRGLLAGYKLVRACEIDEQSDER